MLIHKQSNSAASEAGFTLLEILIGLSLLAVMMSLLFGTIRMGARVWDKGEERAVEVDRMLTIQNFLRQKLTRARPVYDDFSEPEEDPVFSFSGTEESIQFVSVLPDSAGRGGMHLFELLVGELDDAKVLLLKLSPFYPPLDDVDAPIEDVRLLRGVDRIELAYFGIDEETESEDADWFDSWEEKDFMPELVKLVIYMQDGKQWPVLIVRPMITQVEKGS